MKKREKQFMSKLIVVCFIALITAVVSMVISLDYLVNKSGVELNFVKPEAYKDYQD